VKFFLLDTAFVEEMLAVSHKMDSAKARVLARISCGSMGEALKLKNEDFFIKRERIIKALSSDMFSEMDLDKTSRSDLRYVLNIMLAWYRDILITKVGRSHIINIDKKELILKAAPQISPEKLDKVLKHIISTQAYLDQSANPKLAIAALGLML
jgi:DNA polymerase III gamma/tau subunit